MSKGSKTRKQQERKKKKLAAKAAMKALYKKWAEDGVTKGSRRKAVRSKFAARRVRTSRHNTPRCTNTGCTRCSSQARESLSVIRGPVSPRVTEEEVTKLSGGAKK